MPTLLRYEDVVDAFSGSGLDYEVSGVVGIPVTHVLVEVLENAFVSNRSGVVVLQVLVGVLDLNVLLHFLHLYVLLPLPVPIHTDHVHLPTLIRKIYIVIELEETRVFELLLVIEEIFSLLV